MPKTKLTNERRQKLLNFMAAKYDESVDFTKRDKILADLITRLNKVIRAKYPEEDMVVLRKYDGHTRLDTCLRLTNLDTGRVFSADFQNDLVEGKLSDIPYMRGCYGHNEIFSVDTKTEAAVGAWDSVRQEMKDARYKKIQEYNGFCMACKTLEDFEEVVPLPADLRASLGATSNAIAVINPDIIASIKKDFKAKKAA